MWAPIPWSCAAHTPVERTFAKYRAPRTQVSPARPRQISGPARGVEVGPARQRRGKKERRYDFSLYEPNAHRATLTGSKFLTSSRCLIDTAPAQRRAIESRARAPRADVRTAEVEGATRSRRQGPHAGRALIRPPPPAAFAVHRLHWRGDSPAAAGGIGGPPEKLARV